MLCCKKGPGREMIDSVQGYWYGDQLFWFAWDGDISLNAELSVLNSGQSEETGTVAQPKLENCSVRRYI